MDVGRKNDLAHSQASCNAQNAAARHLATMGKGNGKQCGSKGINGKGQGKGQGKGKSDEGCTVCGNMGHTTWDCRGE